VKNEENLTCPNGGVIILPLLNLKISNLMKITLNRIDDAYLMEAKNESGNTVQTDGSPAIGGGNQAMRPMQMLLVSLGGCSSIDVISFLKKQRQDLRDIQIEINGQREEGAVPSLFQKIHVFFKLFGAIDDKKAERAVRMSMDKYCSVAKMVEKQAEITWEYSIEP